MQVGGYQVLEELARGSSAIVYRAYAPRLGREVALKLSVQDPAAQARLAHEQSALAALEHPHLVGLLDQGAHMGRAFLVVDLVEGPTLEARVRERGPLRSGQAAQLVRKLAEAVAHAHARGVLHGGIGAREVLLQGSEPWLSGFGATPARGYAPPEPDPGAPADVYGLGAVLYVALTGQPPGAGTPTPPRQLQGRIDPALEAVCLRCLARDPAARPTLGELARELEAFLDVGSSEEDAGAVARPRGGQRGVRVLAGALAALLAVAAVLLGVLLWRRRGASRPPPPPNDAAAASSSPAPADPSPDLTPLPAAATAADLMARAEVLRRAGKSDEALKLLDRTIAQEPSAAAHLARGRLRLALGAREDAVLDLRRALSLAPDQLPARRALGEALLGGRKWDEARGQLSTVVRQRDGDAEAWRWWGRASLETNRWGDALYGLRRALALAPDDAETHAELGRLYGALGRHALALAELARALELAPSPRLHALRLCAALRAADVATAARELDGVGATPAPAELAPALEEGAKALIAASRSWSARERKAAVALLQRLVPRYPKAWLPPALLGQVQLRAEQLEPARVALELAVRRDPKQRMAGPLAVAFLLQGQPARALETLQSALSREPRYALAVAAVQALGPDRAGARQLALEHVQRQTPTPPRLMAIATLHALAGYRSDAVGLLSKQGLGALLPALPSPDQGPRVAQILRLQVAGWLACAYPTRRLRDLLAKHGDDPFVVMWIAGAAEDWGQPIGLRAAAVERLTKLLPDVASIAYRLAGTRFDQGKLAEARRLVLAGRRRWPRHPAFISLLAAVEMRTGHPAAAIEAYRDGVALNAHPMLLNNLANLLLLSRPPVVPEALRLARQAVQLGERQGSIHETLAWALTLSGRLDLARVEMRKALELAPRSSLAWAHQAELLLRCDDRTGASRAVAVAELLAEDADQVDREDARRAIGVVKKRLKR